jgi:hypothetical protein
MTKKKAICVSLILLIIASMTLASVRGSDLPVVSLALPPEDPEPGDTFLINVTITNVEYMKGCGVMLGYNNSLLEAIRVYPTDITDDAIKWLPVNETMQFNFDRHPVINNTRTYLYQGSFNYSYVWISAWGFTSFTGTGAVFMINFTAIAMGNCTLDLFTIKRTETGDVIYPDQVEVLDILSDPIDHTVADGSATVIPEFPIFIIMPLLLITSLAAVFLGKTFWSKKRKDTLIAE